MEEKYIHQSAYGHIGDHSAKPLYVMRGDHVYSTPFNTEHGGIGHALYTVRDGKWYATAAHPGGASQHAMYEMRGDKIHTTAFHPAHDAASHVFEIR